MTTALRFTREDSNEATHEYATDVTSTMMTQQTAANETTFTYEDLTEIDAIRYTLIVLQIGGITMSVLGNAFLIVYVLLHGRRSSRPPNATAYLILNLAACDLVKSLIHQPMRLIEIIAPNGGSFRETNEFCQSSGFVVLFLGCVGFHTIVAISQERLLLVCYPLTAKRWLTRATMWKVLASIWLIAFCSALPFPLLFSYRASVRLRTHTYKFCTINIFRPDLPQGRYYYLFIFTAYYALPALIVAASYARVFLSLSDSGAYNGNPVSVRDAAILRMLKHRKSLAKMMVAIAVCFTAFEGPLFLTLLYLSLGFRVYRDIIFLKMVVEFLPTFSSVVNPLVYSLRAKTLRRNLASGGTSMGNSTHGNYGTEVSGRYGCAQRGTMRFRSRGLDTLVECKQGLMGTVVANSVAENNTRSANAV